MSRLIRRGGDRETEIATVAAGVIGEAPVGGFLTIGDGTGIVGGAMRWNRCVPRDGIATPWPDGGPFDGAVLRLPGSWPSFRMALHAVAARLKAEAPLWIYGGGDEGIVSVPGRLDGLFDRVETLAIKRRSRVLQVRRTAEAARGDLEDWREVGDGGLVSYPGLFAHGRIDAGTALLLESLPEIRSGAKVLDFGCGPGLIGRTVRERAGNVDLTLLDHDAVALHAARQNVIGAETILSDGWKGLDPRRKFDLILSNPPLHRGRAEDFDVLMSMIEGAPQRLRPRGSLIAVIQRTVGAGKLFAAAFKTAEKLAETPQYQVWRGTTK